MTGPDLNRIYHAYTRQPDAEEMNALCAASDQYIRRLVRRRLPADDADDVTQEILSTAWSSLGTYRATSTYATWLHAMAQRRITDHLRQRYRQPVMQYGDEGLEHVVLAAHPVQQVTDIWIDGSHLPDLSDQDRRVLDTFARLRDFEAAAAELGTTPKALRSRLDRIRTRATRPAKNKSRQSEKKL